MSVAAVNGSGEGEPSALIHFTQELGTYVDMTAQQDDHIATNIQIQFLCSP